MNASLVDQVVECRRSTKGYILYPYRPSSIKNRDSVHVRARLSRGFTASASTARNRSSCRRECLVQSTVRAPASKSSVRFLHPMAREVGALATASAVSISDDAQPEPVSELARRWPLYQTWQEAVERTVVVRFAAALKRSPSARGAAVYVSVFVHKRADPQRRRPTPSESSTRRAGELQGRIEVCRRIRSTRRFSKSACES